jgi:signal transduction histidine kinase
VENVLRFSRLGRGDEKATTVIDVGSEAARIVEEFAPLAASRKAAIEVDAVTGIGVRIRPEALRHVLVNLLDNAVKYGPQAQTITVKVTAHEGRALISVSDQGAGVAPALRSSIWRAFERAHTATGAAGSGIGLTIVQDIVTQNDGKVWVDSAETGGARFTVSLPAVALASESRNVAPTSHPRHETASVS